MLSLLFGVGQERGHAEVINYQGRLSISGVPFDGVGRFRFAVVEPQGRVLWSSAEMKLHVSKGEYAVRLGDSAQAPSIDGQMLLELAGVARLRIWFAHEGSAWVKAGPDVPLDMHLMAPTAPAILAPVGNVVASSADASAGAMPASDSSFVTLPVAGAPSLGSEKASLVLVEFTDLRSPACVRFQKEVLSKLKAAYIDTGKLRLVTRVLPTSGPQADDSLARAAWCSQAQGKFWEMRERLFSVGEGVLTAETAAKLSADAQLDGTKFSTCFAEAQTANAVLKEAAEAAKAGITKTPTFVLGQSAAGMVAGMRFTSEPTFENLAAEIEKNLSSGGTL